MRSYLTILFAFAWIASASAQQTGSVRATVIDAKTQEGMAGAVIEIAPTANPDNKKYYTSGYKGEVSVAGLAYGEYIATASFIGYDSDTLRFRVSAPKQTIGKFSLSEAATNIETVVKEVKAIRTSQRGDTVSYNAGAFKVTADADVEGLLKKMPGITVNNGEVEAQGETVKKVFVDGKEFFGEDVTSAIKSLPAQAVDRIEVYDKLSDQAEFSGMDDGEGYKAINIVTKPDMRQGQFGKLYAGYGYDADTKTESHHKYLAGGNANIFNGDSRISFIGLFNNVNQQNFSFEDILGVSGSSGGGHGRGVGDYMVRPQSGVARVNAIGVNYSDSWGKRDQVTFQGSYFFNGTNTTDRSTRIRWYEDPSPIDTLESRGYSRTENYNNRFNARIEWKISGNQSLMIRPSLSFQTNDPYSTTNGMQYGQSGYSLIDNFSDAFRHGYNLRTGVTYRAKLGKNGRTLTLDTQVNYSDQQNRSNTFSNIADPITPYDPANPPADEDATDLRYQRILSPSYSYRLSGRVTYTEPVAKYAQVSIQYRPSFSYQERNRRSYVTGDNYDIEGLTPDPALSSLYNSAYMIHRVGPGFRYSKQRNTFVVDLSYQYSSLEGEVHRSKSSIIKHDYNNFTYFMMGQLNINRENSIRLFIMSNTENPDVNQLQDVYDVSDAQYISKGNPNLNPSYSHSVRFHYVNSNVEKGRTFMWMFSMRNTQNYIANGVTFTPTLDIDGTVYRPLQYTEPVNLDGYWNLRTHVSYGLPVGFLRCNLNVMAGVNYSKIPHLVNGEQNNADNMGYDARVVLGSNISENIDFTLSWNGTYNVANNSLASGRNSKNEYFNHTAQASMKFIFWKGFSFMASAAYTQYRGLTNHYNDDYLLANVFIGKKIFRNQRGEINFGVNDLFNQNKAFSRTTGSGWTQNATNSVIGRYYSVQFVYNLRHFGKKGSRNMKDYEVGEPSSQQRPGGPGFPGGRPPGGGGPGGSGRGGYGGGPRF